MKKLKKSISMLLVISIIAGIFAMCGVTAFAEENDILDYLTYEIVDGEVTIIDCDESIIGEIVIPDTIEGYPVTTIGGYAFNWCENLTGITIPDSVTSAECGTFYFCKNLVNVTIGSGLTSICGEMFDGCSSLKTVNIPENITEIEPVAFQGSGIESIEIPSSVTTIGIESFAWCQYLTSVVIYGDTTSIENDAFFGCEDVVIYGNIGSAAEIYANENGITFVALAVPELVVKDSNNITVTDTVVNLAPEMSVEDIIKSVENENIQILNKDGKEIANDELAGTGSKVQVLDNDGNVLSEYTVIVSYDVDGNGKILASDARLALRSSAKLDVLYGVYATAANADGNEKITASDARLILRKSAKLE